MEVHRVGRRALLVEVSDTAAAQRLYLAVRGHLGREGGQPPTEVVPGARTVLLDGLDDLDEWRRILAALVVEPTSDVSGVARPETVVPMRYDGADLEVVASEWSCTVNEVVRRHVGASFTVAFCGFAPGFAYCTSDPDLPPVSRRSEPRTSVPAGAVGLAGGYCGVYPRAMPGGWRLLGTTELVMFDPQREPAALLQPGDRVRFEAQS